MCFVDIKKIAGAIVCSVLVLAFGVDADAAKKTVAVFEIKDGCRNQYSDTVTNNIKTGLERALVQSGVFDVVERQKANDIMREQGFGLTGAVDPYTAAKMGKMLGADYCIYGEVKSAEFIESKRVIYNQIKAKVSMDFKLVDSSTGVIKYSEVVTASDSTNDKLHKNINRSQMINDATFELADKCRDIVIGFVPVTAKVLTVRGEDIYIGLGVDSGVRTGDKLMMYEETDPIIDKDTGEVLDVVEKNIGEVTVVEVREKVSIAHLGVFGALTARTKVENCRVKRIGKK